MGQLRPDWRTPKADRLAPDHPHRAQLLAEHDNALAHDDPGYVDPRSGWWVFTAAHLADAGTCCENGCRHCPYE